MRVKILSQEAKSSTIQIERRRKDEESVRFTAVQLMALRSKKLGFPVHLGQL